MKFCASLLATVTLMASTAFGHSWLECADYNGAISTPGAYNEANCRAVARDWNNLFGSDRNQFGDDRGFNYQPGNGRTCRDARGTDDQDYPGGFKAQYRQGGMYRLVWPAKNHARVRDFGTKIFAACGADRAALEANINALAGSNRFLVADFGTNTNGGSVGFGNCGDLSNGDRAVCFGDLTVPNSLNGECTFVWYWPFNGLQDIYTTCWDATVSATGGNAPAPAPAPTPRPVSTPGPTTRPGGAGNCPTPQGVYAQCGGQGFAAERSCCAAGLICNRQNDFYSQCLRPASSSEEVESQHASVNTKSVLVGAAAGVGFVALVAVVVVVRARKQQQAQETHVPLTDQL